MGVYISLHASNKVNPIQWEKAYEETLILVDKFNFIEIQELKKWDKIFDDIRDNPESFKRYYPMVRIEVSKSSTHDFIRAYVANDNFYEMCEKL